MAQTGPPQQQFLQYHYQPQQLQQVSPQSLTGPPNDASYTGLWKAKLSLRISSLLGCIVIISLCIQIAIDWSMVPIYLSAPPAGIAVIFNFVEGISLCSDRDHRGFHPVICVVIDLLLWLGFMTSNVLMGFWGIEEDADDFHYAVLGLGILELLFHVTLFVMACYETHHRKIQSHIFYVQRDPDGTMLISPLGYPITSQPRCLLQQEADNDRN